MATTPDDARSELLDRRQRVESILAAHAAPQFRGLLQEIDLALERFDAGTYGLCETCGSPIEPYRLESNPLVRVCLDHLTPLQARELEQDLDLAARVQRQLLPPSHLVENRWEIAYLSEPASAVSGDYCDVVHPSGSDQELVILLGDISGKGVAASMLVAHLHATMRTLADLGLPVSQLVERANRVFCDSTLANHYATLVCGRLAPSGDAEICNAGHCAPLLVHGGGVTAIEATGVPIGLFRVRQYPTTRVRLAPGDSLILYTDGVTEARNPAGEEFGEAQLSAAVGAHMHETPSALTAAVSRAVASFRGAARRHDDAMVMVIGRTGTPGGAKGSGDES